MKTLLEHINNSIYSENLQYHIQSQQKYQDMLEFFDNDIPDNILERFKSGEDIDYVWENLKSHDIDSLINRLYKEFPIDNIEKFGEGCFIVWFETDMSNYDKFKDILRFYNYNIRQTFKGGLLIEPIYATDLSNYVYNECGGIVYHFTDNKSAKYILENGLRIKGSTVGRHIPKRIYVYAPQKLINKNDIDDVKRFALAVVNSIKIKRYGLCCLKINLNKPHNTNIGFYKDTTMKQKESLFTLNNIPKECITIDNKVTNLLNKEK